MSHYGAMRRLDSQFRPSADEYRTPIWAVDLFANAITLPKDMHLWDPSCGSEYWTIGSHLIREWKRPPWQLFLSELRGNVHHKLPPQNFFDFGTQYPVPFAGKRFAVVTNPPYGKYLEEFLAHAWSIGASYVIFLLPVVWLFARGAKGRPKGFRTTNLRFQVNIGPRVAFELSEEQARRRILWNAFVSGKQSKLFRSLEFTQADVDALFGDYEIQPGDKQEDVRYSGGLYLGGTPSGGYCWAVYQRDYKGTVDSVYLLNNDDDED